MKPRTFFGLALLLPYILWGLCALVIAALPQETSSAWDSLLMPIFFYAFGILFWFFPYTTLAIGLWIWSRNKPTSSLYAAVMIAPLLLVVLMLIESALISLPFDTVAEFTESILGQALLMGGFSLVFGYLCVGIALGVYKFLKSRNIIAEETPQATSAG